MAAGRLIRKGKIFDLGIPFDDKGPPPGGVREFFFAAPPLKVTKAVGSPINPLAIK
ncbi:MAG: hypothetical protein ACYCS7_08605 [Acidimicrobiales bacterium]